MLEERLRPYLVGFVNGHYEELDDQLVFAYNEAHAIAVSYTHLTLPTICSV